MTTTQDAGINAGPVFLIADAALINMGISMVVTIFTSDRVVNEHGIVNIAPLLFT